MPVFARAREFERTCNACGHRWTLSRRDAKSSALPSLRKQRRKMLRAIGMRAQTGGLERDASAFRSINSDFDAQVEAIEANRRCPRCGVDDFVQRPVPFTA